MNQGHIYVISAPSGAGKTSLVNALCESLDHLCVSVSHTTRDVRPSEQSGRNYHFVSTEEFRKMIAEDALLEHAEVFGNFYGTAKTWVEENRARGRDIILELDWQGAQQIRQHIPEAITIFILPPSQKELRRRLESRGTDSQEVVSHRMAKATSEISHYHEFDFIVVNNDFDEALAELQSIIRAHRLKQSEQSVRYATLVKELLS